MWIRCALLCACYASAAVATWAGFDKLEKLIVFGDSWTTTWFDVYGAQPSLSDRLGNVGDLHMNGDQNWVVWLTIKYNRSKFLVYNMALPSYSIDDTLARPGVDDHLAMQVDTYSSVYDNMATPGHADTSLFALCIGMNEIVTAIMERIYDNKIDFEAVLDAAIQNYYAQAARLYDGGARNFLIVNAPPLDRSPWVLSRQLDYPDIGHWSHTLRIQLNKRIADLVLRMRSSLSDSTVYLYDLARTAGAVLESPESYAETTQILDTIEACDLYANGTRVVNTKFPDCPYAVDQYFWINQLHPTSGVHALFAREMSQLLSLQATTIVTSGMLVKQERDTNIGRHGRRR